MDDIRIELADCENVLLREIACKEAKRNDIAKTYWFAIQSSEARENLINWGKVNRAIIARWSPHALEWIKERAWSGKCWTKQPESTHAE